MGPAEKLCSLRFHDGVYSAVFAKTRLAGKRERFASLTDAMSGKIKVDRCRSDAGRSVRRSFDAGKADAGREFGISAVSDLNPSVDGRVLDCAVDRGMRAHVAFKRLKACRQKWEKASMRPL